MSEDGPLDGERFYSSHRAEAVALATALTGRPSVAEDIAQESLLKTLGRFAELRNPHAYLRVVIVNRARSWHRSVNREAARIRRATDRSDDVSDDSVEMLALLDVLPYRHRAAIQLRFWGGWSDAEIAEALGCRPASVRVFIHRGLARLRAHIDDEAVSS